MTKIEKWKMQEKLDQINIRINTLDWWFLRNVMHKDWTKKIDQYWVLISKRRDLEDKLTPRKHQYKTDYSRVASLPNTKNSF